MRQGRRYICEAWGRNHLAELCLSHTQFRLSQFSSQRGLLKRRDSRLILQKAQRQHGLLITS